VTSILIHLAAATFLLSIGVYNVADWRRKRQATKRRPPPVRGPDGRWRTAN
jgi:hypothetical protein